MSTDKTATLAVAISSGNIPEVLQALETKMKEYEFIQDSKWKTSGTIESFNIKTETKIENLIKCLSICIAKETAYDKAAEAMGLSEYPAFNIGGASVEDVKADVLLRKAIIEQKETMDKLASFKEKAAKFMSEADQKALFFKEMESFLSSK